MPIYKIADLNIEINPKYEKTREILANYITDEKTADFCVEAEQSEIDRLVAGGGIDYLSESCIINTLVCREILDNYDGLFFHSSALMFDGKAYIFSAPSGTGKSTHTALWRKHFGDRVTMINDDKPIIRKKDGVFYVYGTPWMGKSNIGANISAPLKAVFLLERDSKNYAEKVSAGRVFAKLLEATLISKKQDRMSKILELYDEIFSAVDLYLLHCTISDDAVTAAYDAICK
ncbi:hypothetical protein [Ruminococcus sp.]